MARSLAVKVPTSALIAQIEEKIAKINSDLAEYPANVKQFEADKSAHEKNLVSLTIKALTENPELVGENHDSPIRVSANNYSGRSVSISIDADALGFPEAPKKPTNPNDSKWYGREHSTPLEMLEKTLKVLRMTNQEEVNASTYSSVMDLL